MTEAIQQLIVCQRVHDEKIDELGRKLFQLERICASKAGILEYEMAALRDNSRELASQMRTLPDIVRDENLWRQHQERSLQIEEIDEKRERDETVEEREQQERPKKKQKIDSPVEPAPEQEKQQEEEAEATITMEIINEMEKRVENLNVLSISSSSSVSDESSEEEEEEEAEEETAAAGREPLPRVDAEITRICNRCFHTKPLDDFRVSCKKNGIRYRHGSTGRRCLRCRNELSKAYYVPKKKQVETAAFTL
jgi:hypothetical protein